MTRTLFSADQGIRVRWARQENLRRELVYERQRARWARTYAELQAMIGTACSYTGMSGGRVGDIEPRPEETLLWTATGVDLVLPRIRPDWRPPGYTALTPDFLDAGSARDLGPAPPATAATSGSGRGEPLVVLATGSVAVTDERVLFVPDPPDGERYECSFPLLLGLAHLSGLPCTLFDHSGRGGTPGPGGAVRSEANVRRRAVRGLLLPAGTVHEFRFMLSLALADQAGDRAGFVGHLEHLLAGHARAEPALPARVKPADAPPAARLVLRKVRRRRADAPAGPVRTAVPVRTAGTRAVRPLGVAAAIMAVVALSAPTIPADEVAAEPTQTAGPAPGPTSRYPGRQVDIGSRSPASTPSSGSAPDSPAPVDAGLGANRWGAFGFRPEGAPGPEPSPGGEPAHLPGLPGRPGRDSRSADLGRGRRGPAWEADGTEWTRRHGREDSDRRSAYLPYDRTPTGWVFREFNRGSGWSDGWGWEHSPSAYDAPGPDRDDG